MDMSQPDKGDIKAFQAWLQGLRRVGDTIMPIVSCCVHVASASYTCSQSLCQSASVCVARTSHGCGVATEKIGQCMEGVGECAQGLGGVWMRDGVIAKRCHRIRRSSAGHCCVMARRYGADEAMRRSTMQVANKTVYVVATPGPSGGEFARHPCSTTV